MTQRMLALLNCAKNLYSQADDLVAENPDILEPQGTIVYLYMAICHNLSAIQRELGGNAEDPQNYLVHTFVFCVAEAHDNPVYRYFARAAEEQAFKSNI